MGVTAITFWRIPSAHENFRLFPGAKANALLHIFALHRGAAATIAAVAREPAGGLIAAGDPFINAHRALIIRLAQHYRLPAIFAFRQFVAEGGLVSYGPDSADIDRRSASYVDRIFKGEKPADLPVQAPVKYELVINLKTAKALGLTVALNLQQLADEVIE